MLDKELSTVNKTAMAMEEFKLDSFINYDAGQTFSSDTVANIDSGLDVIANAKNNVELAEHIRDLADKDLLSALKVAFDSLGLGEFSHLLSSGSTFVEGVVNTMVEMMGTFGAGIFTRLEVLGLVHNQCSGNKRFKDDSSVLNIALGALFALLKCYGFSKQVDQIVDIMDPLVEKEIVSASYNLNPTVGVASTFTPAIYESNRTGERDSILAKQLDILLADTPIDNVIHMKDYTFSKSLTKYNHDTGDKILKGLNNDTSTRLNKAEDYDKIIETLDSCNIPYTVTEEHTKFIELANAKVASTVIVPGNPALPISDALATQLL